MITVQSNNNAAQSSASKGVQFLSPRHVPTGGSLACKITKVTTDKPDNFSNPYVVYFSDGGNKYSKGFKPTSDALATLVNLFGQDEAKWIGKAVLIGKTTDDDGGERLTYGSAPNNGKKA